MGNFFGRFEKLGISKKQVYRTFGIPTLLGLLLGICLGSFEAAIEFAIVGLVVGFVILSLRASHLQKKKERAFLDDLKERGVSLKISKVERDGLKVTVFDENYGEIWSCWDGDLSFGEQYDLNAGTSKGDYERGKLVDVAWDEDTVTLRFRNIGKADAFRKIDDRYFEKKFNVYKEVLGWREL